MEFGNQLILISAGLVTLSIFAGLVSARIGAPLLLVFLVLGMLAGEDGPGGIDFDNFQTAYVIGSIALAVILFDGGLRTRPGTFRLALTPALLLATLGVLVTALLTGFGAMWILGTSWLEGLLVGSLVASTDAAAVFFLLHLRGMRLRERVSATLEVESGLNDPMAVFLTLTCVALLDAGVTELSAGVLSRFGTELLQQLAGGAVFGIGGGYALLALVNRLQLASGLYPILAVSVALVVFGGAQSAGTSGFLAVYLTGFVLGSHRHRATELINRFHDGLAWLSQIAMFLMLGLLVTPSELVPRLLPTLAVATFLMLVARPAAVLLCLFPFRFSWSEQLFVAWVGLRGAVPIFLGTLPVLAGVEGAHGYFQVAYVVVLTSLIAQGWTVGLAGRSLGVDLPPLPEAPQRADIDLPAEPDKEIAVYTVQPASPVAALAASQLRLPAGTELLSVIRDGGVHRPEALSALAAGDQVLLITSPAQLPVLDHLFGARGAPGQRRVRAGLGQFAFDGAVETGPIADFYGFPVADEERHLSLGECLYRRLAHPPGVGDRVRVGPVELVVQEHEGARISRVGVDLSPMPGGAGSLTAAWRRASVALARLWRQLLRAPDE